MFFQFLLRWWSLSCTVAETITPMVKLLLPMCLQFSPFFTSRTKTSFNNFSWILHIKRGSLPVSASQSGRSEAPKHPPALLFVDSTNSSENIYTMMNPIGPGGNRPNVRIDVWLSFHIFIYFPFYKPVS